MKILKEKMIIEDIAVLEQAWSDSETFALLPEKLAVTDQWIAEAINCMPAELGKHHFIMLTSGTTGDPKLVVGSRKRSEQLVTVLHKLQDSESVKETLVMLPLSYTYAFVNQWLWAHVHRRGLLLTIGLRDANDLARSLMSTTSAMLCLVGVQLPLLISQLRGKSFPSVIRIHFAGGRFPQERLEELHALFPNAQIFNNYGCAEAMPRLTLRRSEDAQDSANIGFTLPGVELKNDDGNALMFRSRYGAVGIVENGRYKPIGDEEWIPTGDLGLQNEDLSWRLIGRQNDVFKRHGEKVSLPSLTNTVASAWSGQCAFYREVDSAGEEGCNLILAPYADDLSVRPILLALRKNHPRSHWPLRIESVDALPLLSNGKINPRDLLTMPNKIVH